jgi:hypothetical protein
MKQLLFLLLIFFSSQAYADGVDEITVLVNGKRVYNTLQSGEAKLKLDSLKVGDTLEFVAWTDWSMLEKSTMRFETSEGALTRELKRNPTNTSEAHFRFIVDEQFLRQNTFFVFHYHEFETALDFWHFASTDFQLN